MNKVVDIDINFDHEKKNMYAGLLSEIKEYNESEHSFAWYFFSDDAGGAVAVSGPWAYCFFLTVPCFFILKFFADCGWLLSLCAAAVVLAAGIFIAYRCFKKDIIINPKSLYGRLSCISEPEEGYKYVKDISRYDTPELSALLLRFIKEYEFLVKISELVEHNILDVYVDANELVIKLEHPDTHMVYSYSIYSQYDKCESTAVNMPTLRWDDGHLQYILPYQYKFERALY